MDMQQSIKTCFSKYTDYTGRATRSEYWWFILFYVIVMFVVGIFSSKFHALPLIVMLIFFCPNIFVATRRLHDINRSGWWQLLAFIPIIGALILLYWFIQPGTTGPNNYGAPVDSTMPTAS